MGVQPYYVVVEKSVFLEHPSLQYVLLVVKKGFLYHFRIAGTS